MRKLICCAASAAALAFVAFAADTAAPKKKVTAPATRTGATPAAHTATPAAHTAAPAAHTATPAAHSTVASKGGAPKQGASHTATTGTRTASPASRTTTTGTRRTTPVVARRPMTTWRNRQASPTTDRFKEIQDALVTKGYLRADDATGKWDSPSIDAMKRFQAEQNLDSTGKINSLSLIALGLGPKYEAAPLTKPSEAPNDQE